MAGEFKWHRPDVKCRVDMPRGSEELSFYSGSRCGAIACCSLLLPAVVLSSAAIQFFVVAKYLQVFGDNKEFGGMNFFIEVVSRGINLLISLLICFVKL